MKRFHFFIVYLLVQSILINSANAAGLNGWSLSNPVAQGASVLYQGAKNVLINGKNVAKTSTALITPTATQVAKLLGKGVAGVALSVAVEQLIGAVDWVLDPANNQIKYKVDPNNTGCKYLSLVGGDLRYAACGLPKAFMLYSAAHYGIDVLESYKDFKLTHCVPNGTDPDNSSIASGRCYFTMTNIGSGQVTTAYENFNSTLNPDYSDKQEEAKIPLDVVAAQVISNAESGDAAAQEATKAAAAEAVAEAENDDAKARPITKQLEENARTETDESASAESKPKDPAKPELGTDIALEFPIFCNWAPSVCEAATTVINFPTTLTDWWETGKTQVKSWANSISDAWTSAKDWAKSEESEDTELDIPEPELPKIDTDIAFSGECPADKEIPFKLGMGTINFKLSYSLICKPIADAKPILIFVGFFLSALIIGGIKT